jgi:secondary thiamine-phosphate synthase enzyme
MHEFTVRTQARAQFIDITAEVERAAKERGLQRGSVLVFVPHTTAGITINENADPDVVADILAGLERLVPRRGNYRHTEGNSDAHIKASLMGASVIVLVESGRLVLGTWQGIYFCEFDGPRSRKVFVQTLRTKDEG